MISLYCPHYDCDLPSDLLYLGDSNIVELPSFSPVTSCSVKPHPVSGLRYAVTGIVDGEIMVCGGQCDHLFNTSLYN